jgi:transposase
MNKSFLTEQERKDLRAQHRAEKNGRSRDRIKAVLMADNGWTYKAIAEALLVDEVTVSSHVKEYQESGKLHTAPIPGRPSKLTEIQTTELLAHLTEVTYTTSGEICNYVKKTYGVTFEEHSMCRWLGNHGFVYKKPKTTPCGADPEKQKEFVEQYEKMLNELPEDEPMVFCDAVHPTSETRVSYGWIPKGMNKSVESTASRARHNIVGALNLETMDITTQSFDTVNTDAMKEFFAKLREYYHSAPYIHVILDNGGYNTSKETRKEAKRLRIKLHYLPPRSPNLNPIERVWKIMHERVQNNIRFENAKEFRYKIDEFFADTWHKIKWTLVDRVNDNFHIVKDKNILHLHTNTT